MLWSGRLTSGGLSGARASVRRCSSGTAAAGGKAAGGDPAAPCAPPAAGAGPADPVAPDAAKVSDAPGGPGRRAPPLTRPLRAQTGLVVGAYETGGGGFELTAAAAELDERSGGKLSRQLNE